MAADHKRYKRALDWSDIGGFCAADLAAIFHDAGDVAKDQWRNSKSILVFARAASTRILRQRIYLSRRLYREHGVSGMRLSSAWYFYRR